MYIYTPSQCYVHAGPLLVEGSLSQFPGGEVEVSFDSDRSKANYQCVLLDQGAEPSAVIPCETLMSLFCGC